MNVQFANLQQQWFVHLSSITVQLTPNHRKELLIKSKLYEPTSI